MSENIFVSKKKKTRSYDTKYISQIVKYNFFLENQLEIYKIINEIPNNSYYFYIFETASLLMYSEMQDDLFINNNNNILCQKSNYYLLKYPECKLYSLNEYLSSICFSKKYVFFVLESYKKLLRSIEILIPLHIVHNSISKENVYMNEQKEILLTQFQVSMHLIPTNINAGYFKQFFKAYMPSYAYWPFEFHILSFIFSHNQESISKRNIEQIMNDVINENETIKLIELWYPDSVNVFRKEGIIYWCKYINKPNSEIITDICKYYYTWDNSSISSLFLNVFKTATNKSNLFFKKMIDLFIQNVHFVPDKRITVQQTLSDLDTICYSTTKETFVDMFAIC